MGNGQITILEYTLEDCKGNLRSLQSNWGQVPAVPSSTITCSKGYSAEAVADTLKITGQVSMSFDRLLYNSVLFFEKMGVAFEESDQEAAKNINSIVIA